MEEWIWEFRNCLYILFSIKFLSLSDALNVPYQNRIKIPFKFIIVGENAIKCILPIILNQGKIVDHIS